MKNKQREKQSEYYGEKAEFAMDNMRESGEVERLNEILGKETSETK